MNEFLRVALSVCKTIVNWYWGEFDGLMSSLAALVVLAHVTDGICAIVDGRPMGGTGIRDMLKSILVFILVGVGNIIDTNVLTNTPTLRTTVILFYLSLEGVTLLSNSVHLGLPVPEQMKTIFEQLRQERNDDL